MSTSPGGLPSIDALLDDRGGLPSGDIEEEYTIIHSDAPKATRKTQRPRTGGEEEDEPLIDTTAPLFKNSKKTKRMQKQQQKRQRKAASKVHNFLELPPELLGEVLSHLLPTDIFRLSLLNHATYAFVQHNEASIAKDITDRKFWVLKRCFPLPRLLSDVDEPTQVALLNPRRQQMTELHKKPYQHIQPPDPQQICTCASCLLAWNDLNLVLDLAHFQQNLDHREPIPMIERGTQPEWNTELTSSHAEIVERAMGSPLTYAAILEKHLHTIAGTLLRPVRFPARIPMHRHNKALAPSTTGTAARMYDIKERDAEAQDDRFLERMGKESFEFPFHRDRYYGVLAYVPNRKWSRTEERWMYYAKGAHERDLEWARKWFLPAM